MSLFNKPKRNIRRRPFNDEDEDNENRMEAEDAQPIKIKTKKKDKPKQTRLSFGEELEQGVYTHRLAHTMCAIVVLLNNPFSRILLKFALIKINIGYARRISLHAEVSSYT